MCGISETELVFIGLIVLLFLGPKQIPKFFRTIGKIMYEIRKTTDDFKAAIEIEDEDLKKAQDLYGKIDESAQINAEDTEAKSTENEKKEEIKKEDETIEETKSR